MKRLTGKLTLLAVLVALFAALTVSASAEEQGIRIQMGLSDSSPYRHWHGSYITIEKDGALVDTISLTEEDMTNGLEEKEWTLTGEDYDPEAIYAVKFHQGENPNVYPYCAVTVWVDGTRVYRTSYNPQKFLYTNCPHASYEGRVCTFCGYECPCTYSEREHETSTCTLCGRTVPVEVLWGASPDALTSRGTWQEMYMESYYIDVVYVKLINDIRIDENYDSGDAAAIKYGVPPKTLCLDLNGHTIETAELYVYNVTIDDSAGGGKISNLFAGEDLVWYYGIFRPLSRDSIPKLVINGGTFESLTCVYSDWDYPGIVEVNGGTFIAGKRGFYIKKARSVLHLNKAEIRYGVLESAVVISGGAEVTFGDVVLVPTGNSAQDVWVSDDTGKIDLRGWTDAIDGVRVYFYQNYLATDVPLPAGYAYFDGDTPVHSLEKYGVYTVKPHPTHEVSFDANGGTGEMRSVNTFEGYVLPECSFTAPEGKIFCGWRIGREIYQPGDMPELSADIVAVADWRYDTDFAWGLSAGDDSLGHGTWEEAFAAAAASETMLYVQLNRAVSLTGALAATTGVQGTTLDLNGCELRLDSSVELSGLGLSVGDGLGGGRLVLETADGLAPMFTANRGESTQPPIISFGAADYETNSYFVHSTPGADIYVLSGNDSVFTSTGPGFFYFGGAEDEALMTSTFHRPDGAATTDGAFAFDAAGNVALSNLRFTGDWSDCAHLVVKGKAKPGVSMSMWAGELSGLTVLCEDADHPAADHLPLLSGYAFFAGSAPSHVLEAGTVYTVGEYTTYNIAFLPGEGSGKTKQVHTFTGYTMPDGDFFTPPTGKKFSGWLIGGEFYEAGDTVTLTKDRNATAQYVEDFDVYYGPSASELTGKGSLADAFAAFAASDGYIKLNRSFTLTGGDAAVSAEYAGSGFVTLDLAGFDITVDKTVAVTGGGRLTVTDSVGRGSLHLEAADAVTPMFRVTSPAGQLSSLYLSGGSYFTNGYFIRTSAEGESGCSNVWVTGGEFTSTGSGGFYLTNSGDNLYLGSLTFHASGQGALADKAIYIDGESKLVLYSCTFSGTWSGAHIILGPSGAPNLDLTKAEPSIVGTKIATSVNTAATDIPLPRNYAFCTSSGRGVHLLEWGFAYEIRSYPTYELRFDSNGGSGGMKTVYTFNGYVLPECAFTAPAGKVFAGWLVGTEVYQSGEAIELTQDVSAMAQWKIPATMYFEPNGGTGEMQPLHGFVNDYVELPNSSFVAPEGRAFAGWEVDGIICNAGDTYCFTGAEVTAKALWRAVYKVWVGGEAYEVFAGESLVLPECTLAPPEEGYVFLGWVEERGSDGTVYTVGQMYTPTGENVRFLAKWGVTVSFEPNGGSGTMDTMIAGVGDPFYVVGCGIEPPEGKVFTHWLIEGGEACYPDTTIVLDVPITLIAQWKTPVMVGFAVANEYGDAEVYDMREFFAEDGFVLPECEYPAPEGMVFSHWIIQGGDGTRYYANTEVALPAGEVVFVAQWRDASFSVDWSVSGTTLNVTLGKSAQTFVRRIIFAEYAANGQLSGVQIALPESGGCSFVCGAGEGKLFFLDENGVPVLAAQNVILE